MYIFSKIVILAAVDAVVDVDDVDDVDFFFVFKFHFETLRLT